MTSVATLASGTNVGTYADNLTSATGTGLANYTIGYVNGSLSDHPGTADHHRQHDQQRLHQQPPDQHLQRPAACSAATA